MSIRGTVRITGVAKNTVSKFLLEVDAACDRYHDTHVRNPKTKRVECDEIWSFHAKDKNLPTELRDVDGVGSVWSWVALDAENKLAFRGSLASGMLNAEWHLCQTLQTV